MYEYVRVCISIIRGCKYSWSAHIFLSFFGFNIQCTVLRRCISAFINKKKSIEGMTKFIHKIKCICLDILTITQYMSVYM